MAGDVAAEFAVTIGPGLGQDSARALVHADDRAKVRRGLVDWSVVRTRQSAAAELVGPPEDADESQFFARVFELGDRAIRVLQGNERDAVESPFVVTAIVRQPGVISAANSRAQLRVEVVAPHDI